MTVTTRSSRWRRMPAGVRAAIVAVVVLVVLNAGLGLLDAATRGADRTGSRASSFSTAATGTAGYAALLQRYGHPASRARGELHSGTLDPRSVLVVLDAGRPSDEERRAVADFTHAGGRLVAGGPDATAWAGPLRAARVDLDARGADTDPGRDRRRPLPRPHRRPRSLAGRRRRRLDERRSHRAAVGPGDRRAARGHVAAAEPSPRSGRQRGVRRCARRHRPPSRRLR